MKNNQKNNQSVYSTSEGSRDDSTQKMSEKRTLAEWVTFGLAASVLTGLLGLLGYSWLTHKDSPPLITITQEQKLRQADGSYIIPFTVTNKGGQTAEAIKITSEFRRNGELKSTGELEMNFLSYNEQQEGAFIVPEDPATGELQIKVTGYKLP
jgi:uncharacterized protein (TIGR02588 family)